MFIMACINKQYAFGFGQLKVEVKNIFTVFLNSVLGNCQKGTNTYTNQCLQARAQQWCIYAGKNVKRAQLC